MAQPPPAPKEVHTSEPAAGPLVCLYDRTGVWVLEANPKPPEAGPTTQA